MNVAAMNVPSSVELDGHQRTRSEVREFDPKSAATTCFIWQSRWREW